ncbi:hypothetical protein DNTS_029615 [Danionella cerebrum]|uniref:Homeobox domain-containing protein n=1 Tax=Danionella cerebrum TaxID=2873325 RepID=A0A553N5Q6_9TELE|nr:hypothetical protein DNTS_029615 [Danionella translucida]
MVLGISHAFRDTGTGRFTMSYPQFGYPYTSAPQFLMSSSALSSCCESGSRSITADSPAQTPVYCPVYESRLLASARHELSSAAALSVYGTGPYASAQGYGNYVTYGADASAFYSLGAFEAKDGSATAHAGLTPAAAYYPYEPALGQYQYDRYGSIEGGTRRKNATRETTATLKAWLQEHRKNPYPTKGEKIMLAIITKMTLTQVSTWFANARRRLKKENKMSWAPRNKGSDEKKYEDEEDEDDEGGHEDQIKSETNEDDSKACEEKDLQLSDLDEFDTLESESSECELKHRFHMSAHMATTDTHLKEHAPDLTLPGLRAPEACLKTPGGDCVLTKSCFQPLPESKPRIWSLAQTATALSPSEFPACMLKPATGAERTHDSPVNTLRNWVDGVFHDPLFRHSSLNSSQTNTTVSWSNQTKGLILETGGTVAGNSTRPERTA